MNASVQDAPIGALSVCNLLRNAYPRHAAKHVARGADVPVDTARAWVTGRKRMCAVALLRLAARCDRFAATMENALDEERAAAAAGTHRTGSGAPAAPAGTGA